MTAATLRGNSSKFFQINYDLESRLLLLELGLLGKFSNTLERRTQLTTHQDHPTHYIVAMFFAGKPINEGNSFLIYCLPKKDFSTERTNQFVQNLSNTHGHVETID